MCEKCDPMKFEFCRIQIHNSERRGHREGERESLTAIHICHRTGIPFGHVLVERRCESKHCKREGAKQNVSDHMKQRG